MKVRIGRPPSSREPHLQPRGSKRFQTLFSCLAPAGRGRPRRPAPQLERHELRDVPAANAVVVGGTLTVTGTAAAAAAAETIVVRQANNQLAVGGIARSFAAARVTGKALAGNDVIDVRGVPVPVTAVGGSGRDRVLLDPTTRITLGGHEAGDPVAFGTAAVQRSVVRPDGTLYVLAADGTLYRNGSRLSTAVASFAVDGGGAVYALGTNQVLYRRTATAGWTRVGTSASPFTSFVVSAAGVYVLGTDQTLSRRTATSDWAPIATAVASFAVDPAGNVFALGTNWGLYQRTPSGPWGRLGDLDSGINPRSGPIARLNDGVVTVLGTVGADTILGEARGGFLALAGVRGPSTFDAGAVRRVVVYAGTGDDAIELTGVRAAAIVHGGDGDDTLYGGGGGDALDGGGNDGLFGGARADALTGGGGADRFLLRDGDAVADRGGIDAVLAFDAGTRVWTDKEVVAVDAGLSMLHARTRNTRLLKLSNGVELRFARGGVAGQPRPARPGRPGG